MTEALRRLTLFVAFVLAPLLINGQALYDVASGHEFALDFHNQFWPAGQRVLHGLSPYDLGWQDIQHEIAFPYGAVAALLFVPLALLAQGFADACYTLLCIAAVPLALRLLEVRDWRVYCIVFLWIPVLAGWTSANVSLPFVAVIALLWRWRERAFVIGLLLALIVSIKPFIWPLAIWLLAVRRYAAFGYALLCGLALNLVAWAVIGFDQIGPLVELLGLVTEREEPRSFSIIAVALEHGASRTVGYAMTFALAAAAGWFCVVVGRRGDEAPALLLCLVMSFLATPVIWPHYFALLIVPLAILSPRFSYVWVLPVAIMPVAGGLLLVGEERAGHLAVITVTIVVVLRQLVAGSRTRLRARPAQEAAP